jgi:hypothetical protein
VSTHRTNTNDQYDEENQWIFVHAGSGISGKEEFLIINRKTGLHLTCAGDSPPSPTATNRFAESRQSSVELHETDTRCTQRERSRRR